MMTKDLSPSEHLDCLILALESNLEAMDAYEKSCADRAETLLGMASGAAYCAEMIRRTLDAAKKQRALLESK